MVVLSVTVVAVKYARTLAPAYQNAHAILATSWTQPITALAQQLACAILITETALNYARLQIMGQFCVLVMQTIQLAVTGQLATQSFTARLITAGAHSIASQTVLRISAFVTTRIYWPLMKKDVIQ